MLAGDDLTIALFLVGTAITFGAAGMTAAGWKHPILINGLFGLAGLFFLAGIGWPFLPFLKTLSPLITTSIERIATNPVSWFVLLVLIVGLLILASGKHALPVTGVVDADAILGDSITDLKTRLDAIEKDRAGPTVSKGDLDSISTQVAELREAIGKVADDIPRHVLRLDQRDADLEQNTKGILGLVEKLNESLRGLSDSLFQTGVESAANSQRIDKLKSEDLSSLHSDRVWLKRIFGNLLDALQARDVETRFKENDEIVWRLGLKLLRTNPPQYNDPDAWLADYRTWREALFKIDQAKAYLGNRNAPFLDVAHALENCHEMPPDVILQDGNTIVPYKTVHLAFRQYERYREQIMKWFEQKGALPTSSNIP